MLQSCQLSRVGRSQQEPVPVAHLRCFSIRLVHRPKRLPKLSPPVCRVEAKSSKLVSGFEEPDEVAALRSWITSNGGIIHENVRVVDDAPCGSRGVICQHSMTAEEIQANPLIRVPEWLYLTSQGALEVLEQYEALGAPPAAELDSTTQLALHLAHEKFHLGDQSFYHPYIQVLPERPSCAWALDEEELESALHTALPSNVLWEKYSGSWRNHVLSTRTKLHKQAQVMEDRYKAYFTIDQDGFLWALGNVMSRSYGSHPQLGLAPFIDLVNHDAAAARPELVIQDIDGEEEYFYNVSITKNGEACSLDAGDEVYVKYLDDNAVPRNAFASFGWVPKEILGNLGGNPNLVSALLSSFTNMGR